MTDVGARDGLLEGDFGVRSWSRHPRGSRKGSFWVGDCYKLHWVLRLQDPCLGLGLSHWAVGAAAAYWLGCTPVCRVTLRVSRVVRCNSCSHPQSGVDGYRMEALH